MPDVADHLLIHLREARDHVDRHYAEKIDLTTLASKANVSRFHFLPSFAAAYGITPAAYLAARRIERAQDLLRATNLTITEVCMEVGYTSLGSFSVSKATFSYLCAYTWRRVVYWLRRKHPRANWKWIRRHYLPGWWPTEGKATLFNTATVPVIRYRYRGKNIATPWEQTTINTAA